MNTNEEYLFPLDEIIESGKYKVVDLNFFNYLNNLEFTKEVLEEEKVFLESYYQYIQEIKSLPADLQTLFLKALKNDEIVSSHSLEKVNPFMVSMYMLTKRKTAMDKLLSLKHPITSQDFKRLHYTLLENTPSSEENLKFREINNIFVGYYLNGEREIEYIPIDYKLIPQAVLKLLDYYNREESSYQLAFLKGFIVHALIAGLQIFKDGNTRFGRLFQHKILFDSTKKFIEPSLELPALYASKNYYLYRKQYRDLIKNLVIYNDQESWNKWFVFNFHRFEDQIMMNEGHIKTLKRNI